MENENLPLKLVVEVVKYLRCTTTTLMRFHKNSKAFWRVGYRTWHGKGYYSCLEVKIGVKLKIVKLYQDTTSHQHHHLTLLYLM